MDPKKKLHDLCQSVLCMFSSRSFRVSGLTFRSLIRFEFFCVYCVRECSNFILLHVAVQFSHLLKRLSLPHCVFLPLSLITDHKCMDLLLGVLSCLIDLCVLFCASIILI